MNLITARLAALRSWLQRRNTTDCTQPFTQPLRITWNRGEPRFGRWS